MCNLSGLLPGRFEVDAERERVALEHGLDARRIEAVAEVRRRRAAAGAGTGAKLLFSTGAGSEEQLLVFANMLVFHGVMEERL